MVEETYYATEITFELLDDGGKGARSEVEETPAILHILAIPASESGSGAIQGLR